MHAGTNMACSPAKFIIFGAVMNASGENSFMTPNDA